MLGLQRTNGKGILEASFSVYTNIHYKKSLIMKPQRSRLQNLHDPYNVIHQHKREKFLRQQPCSTCQCPNTWPKWSQTNLQCLDSFWLSIFMWQLEQTIFSISFCCCSVKPLLCLLLLDVKKLYHHIAYCSVVEHAAHNSFIVDSSPIELFFLNYTNCVFHFKNYQVFKLKYYVKLTNNFKTKL